MRGTDETAVGACHCREVNRAWVDTRAEGPDINGCLSPGS